MATPNTKTVNIKAIIPIRDTTPPIYGVKKNVVMTFSDILKCLCRRAIVEEILPNGETVRLTTKNFRNDFQAEYQNSLKQKEIDEEEAKKARTGSIEDVDLLSAISEDSDEDLHNEPEEPANEINTRNFVDGSSMSVVGVEPTHVDPEDNAEEVASPVEVVDDKAGNSDFVDDDVDDIVEVEKTEEAEPTITTVVPPKDTSIKKKNSSKNTKNNKKK